MAERPFTSASFNLYLAEKRLMGARCRGCGKLHLPPRPLCSACWSQEMEWAQLRGEGKLAAFTAITVGPSFMAAQGYNRDNPYVAGIVTLAEGPSISARILGVDAREPQGIKVGMPVQLEIVIDGEGEKARPVVAFRAVTRAPA